MNTLTLIKIQIEKAAALHDAQIHVTKYRGVDCQVQQATQETHRTNCYRGRTYVKWLRNQLNSDTMGGRPPIFLWIERN